MERDTAYGGSRTETAMHRQVSEDHGFTAIAEVCALSWFCDGVFFDDRADHQYAGVTANQNTYRRDC